MSDNHASTVDEKASFSDVFHSQPSEQFTQKETHGLFSRKKKPSPEDHADDTAVHTKALVDAIPPVAFSQLFRYSSRYELLIDTVGLVAAGAAGASQPLMTLLFGNLTQDFVLFATAELKHVQETQSGDAAATAVARQALDAAAAALRHNAAVSASYLVCIGIGMFLCTYIFMYIWVYTGEANSKRIREKYLQAVLRQDIAYFDNASAGEVATRIQTDTHLVQQGMSEKVALAINFIGAFVTGFVLAYVRCWRLALAMSSILPGMGIAGTIINKFASGYMQLALKHVADGGTLAEEVISTVRTAHAFGTQKTLSGLYDAHVTAARVVDAKGALVNGGGLGFFFFVMYAAYALAFQFGTTLINEGHGPEMQALARGRGAAAKLFATIDRIPSIDSSDPEGLKPENVLGEITLEDVKFNYPSRPDVPIVKGLNITFPAGKTAALVGASGSG
ncbi:hypothetical protein BDN67DRAFT_985772, partial [Paxillus ammoniavirescens]